MYAARIRNVALHKKRSLLQRNAITRYIIKLYNKDTEALGIGQGHQLFLVLERCSEEVKR